MTNNKYNQDKQDFSKIPTTKALVIFSDSTSIWPLRFLKSGFRHCFIAVQDNNDWIIYEPLLRRTEITIIRQASIRYIEECFESMGCRVLKTTLNRIKPGKISMFTMLTCVNGVKRVLGISPHFVNTPWQLYKYIIKNRKEQLR